MTMTSKFAGRCNACGGYFQAGTPIDWVKGQGARHANVVICNALKVAAAARPAIDSTPVTINAIAIVAFLTAARERGLKFPKARFLSPTRRELRLSLAGATSKNPGAIYLKIDDEYQGLVAADGTVRGAGALALVDTLKAIASDPAKAAKEYGALMGRCSFCGLPLTDAGSVEVGYGPICAKKYGLPHTPQGTPELSSVITYGPSVDVLASEL